MEIIRDLFPAIIAGVGLFGAVAVVIVVGYRRMRGKPVGRLGTLADATGRAIAVGQYPPSLRPGPYPLEYRADRLGDEGIEDADDGTPGSHVRVMRRPDPEPPLD